MAAVVVVVVVVVHSNTAGGLRAARAPLGQPNQEYENGNFVSARKGAESAQNQDGPAFWPQVGMCADGARRIYRRK